MLSNPLHFSSYSYRISLFFGVHITFQCFLCHYILLLEGALSLYVSFTSSRNSHICVYVKTGVETSKKRQYKKRRDM